MYFFGMVKLYMLIIFICLLQILARFSEVIRNVVMSLQELWYLLTIMTTGAPFRYLPTAWNTVVIPSSLITAFCIFSKYVSRHTLVKL